MIIVVPLTALAHEVFGALKGHVETVLLAGSPQSAEDDADDLKRTLANVTVDQLKQAKVIIVIPEVLQLELHAIQEYLRVSAAASNNLLVIDECHLVALWALFRPAFKAMTTWMRTCLARKLALSGTITESQFNVVKLADFRNWQMYVPSSVFRSDLSIVICRRLPDSLNDMILAANVIEQLKADEKVILACGTLNDLARLQEYLKGRQDLNLDRVSVTYVGK